MYYLGPDNRLIVLLANTESIQKTDYEKVRDKSSVSSICEINRQVWHKALVLHCIEK